MSLHLYLEPKVTLLARSEYLGAPHIKWDTEGTPAEKTVEFSGRLCYLSFGEDAGVEGHTTVKGRTGNRDYLKHILEVRHGSVAEHNAWTFLFEGVSRSLTHELVRHRHLSFSQLSQRYVDESNLAFVVPPEVLDAGLESNEYMLWLTACGQSRDNYRDLLGMLEQRLGAQGVTGTAGKKRARQTARSLLPNSAETKIVVTGNARAWRHFVNLRANENAEREIRRLAVDVADILTEEAPNLFQDFAFVVAPDGFMKVDVGHGSI
jgi:thymidylate synthase (FAD)